MAEDRTGFLLSEKTDKIHTWGKKSPCQPSQQSKAILLNEQRFIQPGKKNPITQGAKEPQSLAFVSINITGDSSLIKEANPVQRQAVDQACFHPVFSHPCVFEFESYNNSAKRSISSARTLKPTPDRSLSSAPSSPVDSQFASKKSIGHHPHTKIGDGRVTFIGTKPNPSRKTISKLHLQGQNSTSRHSKMRLSQAKFREKRFSTHYEALDFMGKTALLMGVSACILSILGTILLVALFSGLAYATDPAGHTTVHTDLFIASSHRYIAIACLFALLSCFLSVMGTLCLNLALHGIFANVQQIQLSQNEVSSRPSQIV